MDARIALEALVLVLAWAAALAVRPWRLLRADGGQVPLATPFLACLVLLPWMWSWSGLAALPVPLHWSGAPLVALLLGWPLAIGVITVAGFSTMFSADATFAQALQLTVWSGVLPATVVLVLGHVVRRTFGPNPVAYMLGRAFFVPMLALGACAFAETALGVHLSGAAAELQRVAVGLLAMGEASWTCAVASLLVAWRPRWLATWSDSMYLGRRVPPARLRPHR